MSEIDLAVAALKSGAKQYVTPGETPPSGTTFKDGDQIFLVVLSGDAGKTPLEVAKILDTASGGKHVFAVVVGDEATGYSTLLSGNKAEDLFSRSMDVSNTPQVAMGVFTTLIHRYEATAEGQRDLKKLEVTTTTKTPINTGVDTTGSTTGYLVGGSVLIMLAVIAAYVSTIVKKRKAKQAKELSPREKTYSAGDLREWVSSTSIHDLPPKAASLLTEVKRDVQDIASHWSKVQNTDVGYEVQDICFNLIPKNLDLYRSLPEDLRHKKLASMGVVPDELIIESLTAIEDGLERVREAAFAGSVRDLTVEATFAKLKYDRSALEL